MSSQRRKMLNRLKDFDDSSGDDKLNLEKQNKMNFNEKEKEKDEIRKAIVHIMKQQRI